MGQIFSSQTIDGKQVECMHTGLFSDTEDCGAKSYAYDYVFVGSISAITPTEKDEKEIQIIPEEVFHGTPASLLRVVTSQALCLPKLAVGDRWLFFLRSEKNKPIVLDYYGNDSRPVADAELQTQILRRLATIGDFGLVRGEVTHNEIDKFSRVKGIPGVRVIARRRSDDDQYVSTTDVDGRYEFQPLPPGMYKIAADPSGPFKADESGIDVKPGTCWNLTLSKSPHARISGTVNHSDGSPAGKIDVALISAADEWFTSDKTDELGHFKFDSLRPGNYVVGVNLPGAPSWKYGGGGGAGVYIPTASLYYPSEAYRSGALVIKLAEDETRNDIDFNLPRQ